MIPDFAIAMRSKEPPSEAKCSSPIIVITDVENPEQQKTLVASRAPPNQACYIIYSMHTKKRNHVTIIKNWQS